jgi:hypothetical protein
VSLRNDIERPIQSPLRQIPDGGFTRLVSIASKKGFIAEHLAQPGRDCSKTPQGGPMPSLVADEEWAIVCDRAAATGTG